MENFTTALKLLNLNNFMSTLDFKGRLFFISMINMIEKSYASSGSRNFMNGMFYVSAYVLLLFYVLRSWNLYSIYVHKVLFQSIT